MPYRRLKHGELIREGDEVCIGDFWYMAYGALGDRAGGCGCDCSVKWKARRPLKTKVVAKTAANKRSRKRAARFRRVR